MQFPEEKGSHLIELLAQAMKSRKRLLLCLLPFLLANAANAAGATSEGAGEPSILPDSDRLRPCTSLLASVVSRSVRRTIAPELIHLPFGLLDSLFMHDGCEKIFFVTAEVAAATHAFSSMQ